MSRIGDITQAADPGGFAGATVTGSSNASGVTLQRREWTWMTPLRAVRLLTTWTLFVTLTSGVAMHLLDRSEFPTIGRGLWWAAQTVTSVGYGDAVPHATVGRLLAFVVMVHAIALVTVVTGAVTSAMIEARRQRSAPPEVQAGFTDLAEIDARLRAIEEALRERAAA